MNDKCPYCEQRLHPTDAIQSDMGTKVEFVCQNSECEDTVGVIFFAYTGDLQY